MRWMWQSSSCGVIVLFTDTATPEIYTLSLHDALPISFTAPGYLARTIDDIEVVEGKPTRGLIVKLTPGDRKSTRLNSSHVSTSYAVFCLKKKKLLRPLPPIRQPYDRTTDRALLLIHSH